jgi:hypothetical protein
VSDLIDQIRHVLLSNHLTKTAALFEEVAARIKELEAELEDCNGVHLRAQLADARIKELEATLRAAGIDPEEK